MKLANLYGVEELVIATLCPDFRACLRSYQLLAEAFSIAPGSRE
ncbi:MAG: hypothetical protein ABI234_04990 [Ktedonobacteraceae bacterium]